MKAIVVKQGECLSCIAAEYGFLPETLWRLPENNSLRELRGNPNVLMPGDIVQVPDLRPGFCNIATGRVHRFRRKAIPERLRLVFLTDGQPRANASCTIVVDGRTESAMTDASGLLELFVLPERTAAQVVFEAADELPRAEYLVQLKCLDPITEITGIQARLKNLGFYLGAVDGLMSDGVRSAVMAFQASLGLVASGDIDDVAKNKLLDAHGD